MKNCMEIYEIYFSDGEKRTNVEKLSRRGPKDASLTLRLRDKFSEHKGW